MVKKLGVIVPFRNRYSHLPVFIKHMKEYLKKQNIPFEIIIVNQDNGKQFNRGSLLNIGFTKVKDLGCKYVVFHDVDMLPIDVDYSFTDKPIHLATNFINEEREPFEEYFGGVTLFPIYDFKEIDGYSNKYWDWGYEDTDLLYRCKKHHIQLDNLKIKNMGKPGKAVRFNGVDSYIKVKNIYDLDDDLTFFVSFYPDDIICDHKKDTDYYTIFSIPGYDTSISYNSFSRYCFLTFDSNKESIFLNSKIKTNYKTNFCVTIDNTKKKITVYQDGIEIGSTNLTKNLLYYTYERFFYLGVGHPKREGDERFFKGTLQSFASFSGCLNSEEVFEISNNEDELLNKNFGDYTSSNNLTMYFDARYIDDYKMTDLSINNNNGQIFNCEIIDLTFDDYKTIKIPHRRKSLFSTLPHDENGFVENNWKLKATRWNQVRFHNEVNLNENLIKQDGLSTLQFIEHGTHNPEDNVTIIDIGL
jgi:hypothetical protein